MVNYEDKFNRVAGMEYDLITEKNKWNGRAYFYKSFENNKKGDNTCWYYHKSNNQKS